MSVVYNENRLRQLQSLVGRLQVTRERLEPRELGNMALQVIVARRRAQNVLSGKDYSEQDKAEAKRTMEQIEELEKGIYRLYYILSTSRRAERKAPFQWHLK